MKLKFTVILLTLALISSALAVGTMSKYAIGGTAEDDGQVAKWGINIDIDGTNSFATKTKDNSIVAASGTNYNVVAPGTNSSADEIDGDGIMKVTLKGTPEVAFKLTMDLGNTEDVYLKAGTYTDYTMAESETTPRTYFNLANNYYPVEFTLTHYFENGPFSWKECADAVAQDADGLLKLAYSRKTIQTGETNYGEYANVETFKGTLAALDALFVEVSEKYSAVAANVVLDEQFTLEWEWVFGDIVNDKADTLLGNLAVAGNVAHTEGKATVADPVTYGAMAGANYNTNYELQGDYNLSLNYDFTITIVQLDELGTPSLQ